jgi:hypothetical protein
MRLVGTMAGVGLQLEEAIEDGHDAFEETTDYATSAPGYIAEARWARHDRRRPP